MKQPMIDIAFDILNERKKPLVFIDLFDKVSKVKGLTQTQKENEIAQFFTDITLDDRFANLGDNKWDLKAKHKLEEVKKTSIDDLVAEDEEDEIEDKEIDD